MKYNHCDHAKVTFLGFQEQINKEPLKLANCEKCYSTITMHNNYMNLSEDNYILKTKFDESIERLRGNLEGELRI